MVPNQFKWAGLFLMTVKSIFLTLKELELLHIVAPEHKKIQ